MSMSNGIIPKRSRHSLKNTSDSKPVNLPGECAGDGNIETSGVQVALASCPLFVRRDLLLDT